MKKYQGFLAALLLMISMFASTSMPASAADTDVLQGKKVLVIGDDISAGFRDSNKQQGWCTRLQSQYGMISTPMHNGSGVTISDWRRGDNGSGSIISQIPTIGNYKYDYVLLHGGMADAEKNNTGLVGVATGAVFPNEYTIPEVPQNMVAETFAQGMERLIQSAITKHNGARIGFIINYATPNNSCENARDMERYWNIARQVCEKWNVPYLDLYAGKTADGKSYSYDILDMDNSKSPNHNNNKHLKAAGYDIITPYIAEWMTTIQPYNLERTLATAPTTTTSKKNKTTTTTTTTSGATTTTTTAGQEDVPVINDTTTTESVSDISKTPDNRITSTTISPLPDSQESEPSTDTPVKDADVDTDGNDVLPIVITAVTVAASLAVLVVLAIVIYKRMKS